MWTIPVKIQVAKLSQALAQNDVANGALFGQRLDPLLPIKIYIVRKSVEFCYTYMPNDVDLLGMSNLMIALCEKYAMRAYAIISGATGGHVIIPATPTTPTVTTIMPFYIVKQSDFTNATDYTNSLLNGKDIAVFGNWINRYLDSDEYSLLAGGIVRILISGFDSSAFDPTKIIMRVDIKGTATATANVATFPYILSATTVIPNLPTGSNYERRQVVITPNGYDYTWDTLYEFTDNYPPQPDAKDVGTKQIYEFMYDPVTGKNVCVGQSLNAAI